ncbi:MAG: signal recognition particle receptor subunit alpha, partial [Proteobacteria bacterium]|nr:signal recognition particle receptor subunit alpha [Pseudomonadota bacterium]
MFENLSDRLDSVFKKLKGHGTLSEKNIEDGLKQVRMALLEADVNYKVAKSVISDIKGRALGREVMQSLTPGQQVIKIVNDEFTRMMGSEHQGLNFDGKALGSVMLVGLQGSGKTTTAGKLALYLRKEGRKPFLVPVDVYRPAAIDQLKKIGQQLGVPVFQSTTDMKPLKICQDALLAAREQGCDTLLLDTAGRLHLDEELMAELINIKKSINPSEILLVADAMTGQDAVNIAASFDNALDLSGVILTKMDGDARGG